MGLPLAGNLQESGCANRLSRLHQNILARRLPIIGHDHCWLAPSNDPVPVLEYQDI